MKYLVDVKKKAEEGSYQHLTRQGPNERADRTYNGFKVQEDKIPLGGTLKFGIDFTLGGDIYGSLGCKVSPSAGVQLDDEKNRIGAGIDAKLEAFIKIEAKVWIVKSSAGVNLTVQGADGKSPSRASGELKLVVATKKVGKNTRHDIGLGGLLSYNGLAIYYAYYAEVAIGASSAGSKARTGGLDTGKGSAELKTSAFKESKELCTLIEAATYPDESKKSGSASLEHF